MSANTAIEEGLLLAGGRFNLVVLASRRARQINAYYNELAVASAITYHHRCIR